jgi:hypothetical protein
MREDRDARFDPVLAWAFGVLLILIAAIAAYRTYLLIRN